MVQSGEMDLKTAQLLLGSKGGQVDTATPSETPLEKQDEPVHQAPTDGNPPGAGNDEFQQEVDDLVSKAKQIRNDALLPNYSSRFSVDVVMNHFVMYDTSFVIN